MNENILKRQALNELMTEDSVDNICTRGREKLLKKKCPNPECKEVREKWDKLIAGIFN